jgi:hypothetical protein
MNFRADGSVKTSGVAQGRWEWADRARRKVHVNMGPSWAKDVDFVISLDGWAMTGHDSSGKPRSLVRQK